jgi:hypothetical protein
MRSGGGPCSGSNWRISPGRPGRHWGWRACSSPRIPRLGSSGVGRRGTAQGLRAGRRRAASSEESAAATTSRHVPAALLALREAFKKAGMRTQERQLTYAVKHTERLQAWDPSIKHTWPRCSIKASSWPSSSRPPGSSTPRGYANSGRTPMAPAPALTPAGSGISSTGCGFSSSMTRGRTPTRPWWSGRASPYSTNGTPTSRDGERGTSAKWVGSDAGT